MSPTELVIHDLARVITDLSVKDPAQKRAIIEKTLTSLVKFAISQNEGSQINGIRADMRKVDEIRAKAR
jgi:hypothetical protein